MTDRELIEYAAKAAHMEGKWDDKDDGWFVPGKHGGWASLIRWDPLTINGQAFDLMVKIGMSVKVRHHRDCTYAVIPHRASAGCSHGQTGDAYAATRRAIVRVAAEIGKEMK